MGGATTGRMGGSTSFGAIPIIGCYGGTGGAFMAGTTAVACSAGGAGGAVSINGDINAGGSPGEEGSRIAALVAFSGNGGDSLFGGGAVGKITATTGADAIGYGSGGSGGRSASTAQNGGSGANGLIIVLEFA